MSDVVVVDIEHAVGEEASLYDLVVSGPADDDAHLARSELCVLGHSADCERQVGLLEVPERCPRAHMTAPRAVHDAAGHATHRAPVDNWDDLGFTDRAIQLGEDLPRPRRADCRVELLGEILQRDVPRGGLLVKFNRRRDRAAEQRDGVLHPRACRVWLERHKHPRLVLLDAGELCEVVDQREVGILKLYGDVLVSAHLARLGLKLKVPPVVDTPLCADGSDCRRRERYVRPGVPLHALRHPVVDCQNVARIRPRHSGHLQQHGGRDCQRASH